MRRINDFRLAVALGQPQHSARDVVLTFDGQAADGFQRFGKQFGHGAQFRIRWPPGKGGGHGQAEYRRLGIAARLKLTRMGATMGGK